MHDIKEYSSILEMKHIYISESHFTRNSTSISSKELMINAERIISNTNDEYTIKLTIKVTNKLSEFQVEVTCEGIFGVSGDSSVIGKSLIERNAIAIMFPYVRSQITLITACPGFQPIVLPPINIIKLFEE